MKKVEYQTVAEHFNIPIHKTFAQLTCAEIQRIETALTVTGLPFATAGAFINRMRVVLDYPGSARKTAARAAKALRVKNQADADAARRARFLAAVERYKDWH